MNETPQQLLAETSVRRTTEDLLVGLLGLISSGLTAVVLWLVDRKFGLALYSWMVWFVIPVGAGLAGFAGASGYYFGSILFSHRPSRLLLINIVLASIATFVAIHFLAYSTLVIDGRPVSEVVSFWRYIDVTVRSTQLQFSVRGMNLGTTGEMGGAGYGVAILQIIGFMTGGVIVYAYLLSKPYCAKCSLNMSAKGRQVRYSGDAAAMGKSTEDVLSAIRGGEIHSAVALHGAFGSPKPTVRGLRSTMTAGLCKRCGQHWLRLSVVRWGDRGWDGKPVVEIAGLVDDPVELSGP